MNCRCEIFILLERECMYLDGAQFVFLSRVIIHHHDKIVANVTLLVAAALVTLPVRHQCGYVEDGCRDMISLTASRADCLWKTNNYHTVNVILFPVKHTH